MWRFRIRRTILTERREVYGSGSVVRVAATVGRRAVPEAVTLRADVTLPEHWDGGITVAASLSPLGRACVSLQLACAARWLCSYTDPWRLPSNASRPRMSPTQLRSQLHV